MSPLIGGMFDTSGVWTWFLVFVRVGGMLTAAPGIGGIGVSSVFRAACAAAIGFTVTLAGVRIPQPEDMLTGGAIIATEYMLGYLMGVFPSLIVAGVQVAGQVTAGAIGLGQANMIDPSLGASVSVLARIQGSIASVIFLLIDGHHVLIKAAAYSMGDVGRPMFIPDMDTAMIFADRFRDAFALSVVVAAPILVTLLVTQFVLGLVTKFVPQVNIFIISLPLTIMVGLYIIAYTFDGFAEHIFRAYVTVQETIGSLLFIVL